MEDFGTLFQNFIESKKHTLSIALNQLCQGRGILARFSTLQEQGLISEETRREQLI